MTTLCPDGAVCNQDVSCPMLVSGDDVQVFVSGTSVGDFANFTCVNGTYPTAGHEEVVCLNTGDWSGHLPTCDHVLSWGVIIVLSLLATFLILAAILAIDFYCYRKRRRRVASKRIPPLPRTSLKSPDYNRPRPFPALAVTRGTVPQPQPPCDTCMSNPDWQRQLKVKPKAANTSEASLVNYIDESDDGLIEESNGNITTICQS